MSRRDLISEIDNQNLITTYPSFAHYERLRLGVILASLQIESLTLGSASRLSGLETAEIDVTHLFQLNCQLQLKTQLQLS
jgi:hypothetical protein